MPGHEYGDLGQTFLSAGSADLPVRCRRSSVTQAPAGSTNVMRSSSEVIGGRREFFRASARYAVLGLLAAAAALAARKPLLTGQTCLNRGICSGCGVFPDCGLPAALSARQRKGRPT